LPHSCFVIANLFLLHILLSSLFCFCHTSSFCHRKFISVKGSVSCHTYLAVARHSLRSPAGLGEVGYWGSWFVTHWFTLFSSGVLCALIGTYPFAHTCIR
jgi:hypothetical protein